jgi:hypothetical protein
VFGREPGFAQPPPPVEAAEPPKAPRMTAQELAEHRAAALERRLNTPSSFASRRAVQPEPPGRQLVSMGVSEKVLTSGMHNARHTVVQVELFFDKEHPAKVYYRTPGGVLQSTVEISGKEDDVTALAPISSETRLPGAYEPSPADPPPRPV